MFRKILKVSHISSGLQDKQSVSNCPPNSWLSMLPTEILTIIFNYLTPKSLVTIRELGVKRLTEISLSLKVADFSRCNTVSTEDVSSFFTKDRVDHIREINFDNVFFIKPFNLEKYINKSDEMSFYLSNYSSYLQFFTEEKELAKLSSVPDNSVHSLLVIMTDLKAKLLNHIEKMKKVTGSKLKHLTLRNTSSPLTLMDGDHFVEDSGGAFMCDILSRIVSNSLNISVLNLSELHYDITFPFSALHCLKHLKVLSLSACTMKDTALEDQIKAFGGFVEKCKNVEKFSFYGCLWCSYGPSDESLAGVCKWKKLRSFTLTKVNTFRVCPFLMHIANNCPEFESLELIEVGDPAVCHYIPHIIHIIRKSKKLIFLRINQEAFNPTYVHFWKSLELAKNLQGICLTTESNACIENKMVTDALRKLPFLHIFHLAARRICKNLPSQVKQIMTKNEVQTYDIQVQERQVIQFAPNKECLHTHFLTF